MECNLAVIKGDGIGPEIVTEAMKVLDAVGTKSELTSEKEKIRQKQLGGFFLDLSL